jgi:hypothetical protein
VSGVIAGESRAHGRAAVVGNVLTRPWLLWSLAAVFWARVAVIDLTSWDRPDAVSLLQAGRVLATDPRHLYSDTAAWIASTGLLPLAGILKPAATAALAAPFGLLPAPYGVILWSAGDAAAMLGALLLLERLAAPAGWRRPLFWLLAAYFPAVAADLAAGQLGGYLLLLVAAALHLGRRSPLAAGGLAGAAAALKLYPAFLAVGVRPARLPRFATGAAVVGAAITVTAFVPVGAAGARTYLTGVLLPALGAREADCGVVSVHTLTGRLVGGDAWTYLGGGALATLYSPLHDAAAAAVLYWALVAALLAVAGLAAWRSGWHPVYGPALALGLGGLLPPEVYVYQQLPLLPVVLLVAVRAAELRRWTPLALVGVGLLGMVRQPCLLVVPDVWTAAALLLFGVAAWQAPAFRADAPAPARIG